MNPKSPPLPVAVFISGGGTTLRNLLEKIAAGDLPIEIRLVLSSTAQARGLEFARAAGIPTLVVPRHKAASPDDYSAAMFDPCRAAGVQLVVMGGFLKHVLIPPDFAAKVLNIHPSLIPAHCGPGMYGLRVHQSVLAAGDQETGCTVHLVDNQYDHGPVVLQRRVPVLPGDTPEQLQQRVFAEECLALPEAIRRFAGGELSAANLR